ncbi:hypothetical protein AJ80_07523 [Polytolypa hystricis UAMH7299]|uniref:Aminoglycoside phosphotransferase domain-containing protein n=1 Tax=Polytolypa hystricis (strain UAMH7299) TaxID=1447883 RepID=A0A2B7XNI3_POLH7|nr:hypothetical protein AJ80_07523 [Polytolypa hystricis UAMH7299]
MEKLGDTPRGDIWYSMTPKEQHKVMKQIVEWEARLMSLNFPAYGSIYYHQDLPSEKKVPLPDQHDAAFCIGLMIYYNWWHGNRCTLDIDRGPWLSSVDIFRAGIYHFADVSPDSHVKDLSNYLMLVPCLGFKAGTLLHRPVMRHPDFQPNNILVSDTKEIVGLIDWQHCTILPLGLAAGIPKHFQNYGDPDSENLREPQLDLPSNYDSLPHSKQVLARETMRKRLVHFLYASLTERLNEEHYDAIFDRITILRQRLFKGAGTPWEGDSITLRAEMIRAIQSWPEFALADSVVSERGACSTPPIGYSEKVVRDTLALDAQQKEADVAMDQMRHILGVDVLGWVPNDEYEAARETAREMKAKMLEAAETPHEVTGVKDQFPFDDFDENT